MNRSAFLYSLPLVLLCACASAPPKPTAPPAQEKPAVSATAPTPAAKAAAPVAVAPEHPKLGPGQCVESFDCVDTVGFPPPGHRWTCEAGKCGRAKLPDLGASQDASADAKQPAAAEADEKVVSKTSSRRRKR
jgi:hypothetical protein